MKSNLQLAARSEASDCAYNLFINKQRPEILCAVPEDRPIPSFISSEQWTYAGPLRPQDARLAGFNDKAAAAGIRFNGFYLFQVTAAQGKAGLKDEALGPGQIPCLSPRQV